MAETIELKAWARARSGKGGARSTRREGRIPGILYGDKKDPETIAVDYRAISQQLHTGHFQSTVFTLNVDGTKIRVIPRDVQLDPIRDFPIHVDFLRLSKDALVTVEVPVRFLNEAASPGLKRGGVLNIVRHEIQVRCPSDAIPDHFEVDLTGLEIGDAIHISAMTLPEGVRPDHHRARFHRCDHRRTLGRRGADRTRRDRGCRARRRGCRCHRRGRRGQGQAEGEGEAGEEEVALLSSGASPHALLKPSTRMTR